MTTTIALAGKGGVGKTTISAMVIKYLAQTQPGAVLAIDADPSSNLNMVLGLDLDWTVGDIREDMLAQVKQSLLAQRRGDGRAAGRHVTSAIIWIITSARRWPRAASSISLRWDAAKGRAVTAR